MFSWHGVAEVLLGWETQKQRCGITHTQGYVHTHSHWVVLTEHTQNSRQDNQGNVATIINKTQSHLRHKITGKVWKETYHLYPCHSDYKNVSENENANINILHKKLTGARGRIHMWMCYVSHWIIWSLSLFFRAFTGS